MTKPSQIHIKLPISSLFTFIPCSRISRLETNCAASRSSTHVGSNERSTSDVNTCSDVTCVFVHSKTLLHRKVQASVFFRFHKWVLSLCTLQLPSVQPPVDPACLGHFFHHLNRHKDHVPALGGRVLFQCSHRASHRRPNLVVRSASSEVHSCKATRRRLHCHVALPVQHHGNKERRMDSGLQPK